MYYYFKSLVGLYSSQNLAQFVIPLFYRFQYFTTKNPSLLSCIVFDNDNYIVKTFTTPYRKHIHYIFINFATVLFTFIIQKSDLKLISISEREKKIEETYM